MKTRTIAILSLLLVLVMVPLAGFATKGFQNWDRDSLKDQFTLKRNPDNLIDMKNVTLKDGKSDTSDVTVKVDDLGVVTLSGQASADEDITYATITLDAGTYTFTGAPDSTAKTYMLYLKSGDKLIRSDTGAAFTVSASTKYTVIIRVLEDTQLNSVKIKPVVVSGDKAGDFYK